MGGPGCIGLVGGGDVEARCRVEGTLSEAMDDPDQSISETFVFAFLFVLAHVTMRSSTAAPPDCTSYHRRAFLKSVIAARW